MTDIESEIKQLQDQVKYHAYRYYVLNDPVISDIKYDEMFEKLRSLELRFLDEEKRITNKVACGVREYKEESDKKVRHSYPMKSLNTIFAQETFDKWGSDFPSEEIVCTPKLDGASLSLEYEDGVLRRALRRGDGTYGDPITHLVSAIDGVPIILRDKLTITVRGEVVCPTFSKDFADKFKSHRNFVAGSMNLKSLDEAKTRNLRFIAYDALSTDLPLYTTKMDKLEDQGFYTVTQCCTVLTTVGDADLESIFSTIFDQVTYPLDGIVIRVNNEKLYKDLGYTSHHPNGALAYKSHIETATTIITNVIWQVGKTGIVTPVALLEPVELDGSTIKRVTLHNIDEIERLGIAINDEVEIIKAGMIIPKVLRKVKSANNRIEITIYKCPACNSKLERDGVYIKCTNKDCGDKQLQRLLAFFKGIKIHGFGKATIETLIKNGYKSIYSILTISKETLTSALNSPVMGEKLYNNIQERLRSLTYLETLACIGIPYVNKATAEKLIEHGFTNIWMLKDREALQTVQSIGPKKAEAISSYITQHFRELQQLKEVLPFEITKKEKVESEPDMIIAISGKFPKPRAKIIEVFKEHNIKASDRVTKKTNLLLIGKDPSKSKIEKAVKYGIPVIDFYDSEYIELITSV